MSTESNTIRDSIYGFIGFNDWEKSIINHSCFQRLRRIQQLGLTSFVYPGATHTRFEHSLGVMHLATLMFDKVTKGDSNLKLLSRIGYTEAGLERERQLIRLAALLHDVGHAPFSHASEDLMPIDKNHKKCSHENYSTTIIKQLLRKEIENNVANVNYKITADEIASFIEVDPRIKGGAFWKVLISNQIDADRGDYLMRDSHHIGVKYGIYDYQRLLDTIALGINPETDEIIIGITQGGRNVAESFVLARYQMFSQVYFHRTRNAFDFLLQEALKSIMKETFPSPEKIEEYVSLDDYSIWEKMKHSKNKNCKAILNRDPIIEIFETHDIPTDLELLKFEKIKKILEKEKIWSYSSFPSNQWYKQGDKEIWLINKETSMAEPLTSHSRIVRSLGKMEKIRIYIEQKDREKCKKLMVN